MFGMPDSALNVSGNLAKRKTASFIKIVIFINKRFEFFFCHGPILLICFKIWIIN